MTASVTNGETGSFAHLALPYAGDAEYLSGAVPFIMKGLADDEPVLIAVPTDRLALLRAELGATVADLTMVDMTKAGANPGRIMPTVLCVFLDRHRAARTRILTESIWSTRSTPEYHECVRHEALVNRALVGRRVTVLCPFDVLGLPADAIDDAARTHPVLVDATGTRRSDDYAPHDVLAATNVPLPPVPDAIAHVARTADMTELRGVAGGFAHACGLLTDRVHDFVLALTELASNSIEHAHSAATVLLGRDGDRVVAQVRDAGRIGDPLAGRFPVPPDRPRGRGLLLVNQLADLVRVHTGTAGTTVEVQFVIERVS